jgi:hypothetical protein
MMLKPDVRSQKTPFVSSTSSKMLPSRAGKVSRVHTHNIDVPRRIHVYICLRILISVVH